jgi:hypothetical protein
VSSCPRPRYGVGLTCAHTRTNQVPPGGSPSSATEVVVDCTTGWNVDSGSSPGSVPAGGATHAASTCEKLRRWSGERSIPELSHRMGGSSGASGQTCGFSDIVLHERFPNCTVAAYTPPFLPLTQVCLLSPKPLAIAQGALRERRQPRASLPRRPCQVPLAPDNA